ncbi:MAG: T9SS type A sorting domain-containing protein [Flavobacteriaceae bacterium]
MKTKTTFSTILFILIISFNLKAQVIINETFDGNTIPSGWVTTIQNGGEGTQLWEFGTDNIPYATTSFTSNAAIFNDDAAGGATFNRNAAWLSVGAVDVTGYLNNDLTLSYDYALKIATSEILKVALWDSSTGSWFEIASYNTDTDPTNVSINLIPIFQANPGIDTSQLYVGFFYDDVTGSWGYGAGIDNVILSGTHDTPINDDCQNAIDFSNQTFYQNTQITTGTTNNNGFITPNGCGTGMNDGVWYTFTALDNSEMNIVATAYDFDLEIGVYTGSCGNFTCIENVDSTLDGEEEELTFNAVSGTQYWINLGYWGYYTDVLESGLLEVTLFNTPLENNDCSTPVPLIVGTDFNSDSIITTNVGATESGINPLPSCVPSSFQGIDVWYSIVVPNSGRLTLETNEVIGSAISYTGITAYSGTCNSLTEIACSDEDSTYNSNFARLNVIGQTPGDTLLIRIVVFGGANDFGEFQLSAYYTQPPFYSACDTPEVLTIGTDFNSNSIVATTAGAWPSNFSAPNCGNLGTGEDVFFTAQIPLSGNLTIETKSVSGSNFTNTVMAIYAGCNDASLFACDDNSGVNNFSKIELTNQTPGDWITIRIFRYGNNPFGEFKISAYDDSTAVVTNDIIEGLNLYPNPIKDILNIGSQEEITQVSIYNLLGKLVKTVQPNATTSNIDLSDLATGIYMVKIEANEKVSTQKIIKK